MISLPVSPIEVVQAYIKLELNSHVIAVLAAEEARTVNKSVFYIIRNILEIYIIRNTLEKY